ncbi:MAG: S-layer homology domain-containing protein [Firmicutes bacterium]|nr:S-layer homology domain-containing protein [Bacillota bacterium]
MKYRIHILFSIIIASLIFQVGASAKQINSTEKSLALLEYTGVLKVGDENIERYVTRAEFCDYLFKAMKLGSVTNKRYFSDVPQEYWAAGQINALTEMGVVSYAPDGLFNPDNEITYEQACKLVIYALGYEDYYKAGGNMSTFITIAKNIGINAKVANNTHITLEETANILFQGMSATIAEKSMRGGDLYTVVNSDGQNLFGRNFDIYFDNGQLRSLSGCGLDSITEKGTAIIGSQRYDIYENIYLEPLFGETIDYAYEKNDRGRDKVIYATSYYQEARLVIQSDMVCDSSNSFISFYKDKAESSLKKAIFKDPTILYNGKIFTGSFTAEMSDFILGNRIGSVELIKTDGANYNLIIIKSYSLIYATTYDSSLEILYGRERNINISSYDMCNISSNSGIVTDLPKKYPLILALAESEDGKVADIFICNSSKDIIPQQYSDDEIVTNDGEKYKIDKYAVDSLDFSIQVGNGYTVYFDMNGNICYFAGKNSDTMRIAWLRSAKIKRQEEIYLTIFDHSENATKTMKLAEKVRIDGKKYKAYEVNNIMLAFPGTIILDENSNPKDLSPQVIRYSVNENMEITEIDTTNVGNENPKESLREIDRGVRSYSSFEGWLGMKILCSASSSVTKKMTVSGADCPDLVTTSSEPDDDQYKNAYSIKDGNSPVIAYKWTDKTLYADLVVFPIDWKSAEYTIYMFAGMTKMLDEYGDVVDVAYAFGYGQKMEFVVDDPNGLAQFNSLNYGDLFTPTTKFGNRIQEIKKIFDVTTLTFETYSATYNDPNRYWYYGDPYGGTVGIGSGWYNSECQAAKAYPVSIKDETLGVAYTLANANAKNMEMLLSSKDKSIMVYDPNKSKKESIKIGGLSDIKTFENCGTNCDIIIFTSKNYSGRQIFVIRR